MLCSGPNYFVAQRPHVFVFRLLEKKGVDKIVVGLYPYAAVHQDDLGFKKGEKMTVLEEWVSSFSFSTVIISG